MAPMSRKIPQEIIDIFEKYIHNNVRHLEKEAAKHMLESEFGLTPDQSETMFNTFDKDKNGIMSIWEFQQFYVCMGNHAQEVVEAFRDMDKDESGKLDANEAREGLKTLKTKTGRSLVDQEIDFFVETTKDDDGMMDLGAFTNLLYRLKCYDAPPPPAKKSG